jgi:addiction module HigA family antidote
MSNYAIADCAIKQVKVADKSVLIERVGSNVNKKRFDYLRISILLSIFAHRTSKNNMTSSMLIHPGEMIKDEIEARGMTQKELAHQMGVSYTVFNEILNGKRPVTTEYALLLEAALGTSASIWIGLQADYNMQRAKQDKSFMKRLENIRKIAAIF